MQNPSRPKTINLLYAVLPAALLAGLFAGLFCGLCAASRPESFTFETAYQHGKQEIRVLLPSSYQKTKQYPVLYVLPVERGFESRYGDGLAELQKLDAHNRYGLIIVSMGFEKEPWYGDHATDPKVRQASYLMEFVVPFIEGRYSTPGTPEGRLLFGFSKSGWGAFSLILKNPRYFGYAAAWDAPMMFEKLRFGMEAVFGTATNLAAYRPDLLIRKQKAYFQQRSRLVLTGEQTWGRMIEAPGGGSHTAMAHRLLEAARVKHYYADTLSAPHRWDKSWLAPTLDELMNLSGWKQENGR